MLRSTLLAAVLVLAAPAHAAMIELRAEPVTPARDQVARTLVTNSGTSLCRSRMIVLRHHVGEDGSGRSARLATTDAALPGGAGLVGVTDPDITPASVAEPVQALAIVECRRLTLAQLREVAHRTLELAPTRFAAPQVAMQGVER
jgi:hypothetical protein